jgi:hypothetical protein
VHHVLEHTQDIRYFYHMAISPRGRLDFSAVYSSLFCYNKSRFCNVGHFINAMTIRYVGQNMLEWDMGGNFNFIEQ